MSDKKEQFSRYTPQHPLPEEIKNLARDDTVCKYCGVSYLIHNEIKALEDKLNATEKELALLQGVEKREELLKQENTLLKQQKGDLQLSVETNSKLLSSLNVEIESLKEQIRKSVDSVTSYRNKYMSTLRQFSSLNQTVRQLRQCLHDIRQRLTTGQSEISQNLNSCFQSMKLIRESAAKETSDLESKIRCLDTEKLILVESNKKLAGSLKEKELELLQAESKMQTLKENMCRIESSLQDAETLTRSLKNMEVALNDTKIELEESHSQCRILTVELDQYKIQMKNKTTELNNIINVKKQEEQAHEVTMQKLSLEIRAKENEIGSCMKQLKTLENQCQEFRKKENDIAQQNKLGINEIQDLRDSLQRIKSENEALKAERELMIEAHQNRIEDLRESFKNKMAEADTWPKKLQETVAAEKTRHLTEMKALEDGLKHNFVLELQIEKDKYNELLKKFQAQERDKNNMRETQQVLLEQMYKQETEELQRQIVEAKKQGQEREQELGKEICSLKKIINDLQDRLARLDGADSSKLKKLTSELSQTRQEHLDVQNAVGLLEGKLKEVMDENQFLQNIVRKECEERYELTEALSDARKELLELKKPMGGYSSAQKGGRGSSIYSLNQCISTPNQRPAQPEDPALKLRSPVPTNSINLNYTGQSSRKNSSGSIRSDRNMDADILSSRKRIAIMMGRPS